MYRNALTTRHYARHTVYSYERWVRRFLRFHHMGLQLDMASLEINDFFTHLGVEAQISA